MRFIRDNLGGLLSIDLVSASIAKKMPYVKIRETKKGGAS